MDVISRSSIFANVGAILRSNPSPVSIYLLQTLDDLQIHPQKSSIPSYAMEMLQVIERIPGTALYDALLVLPFGKVFSLMQYLKSWAEKVCCGPSHPADGEVS